MTTKHLDLEDAAVPLADAALTMKRGWSATRDAVLRGDLRGFRRGRDWYVERDSLDEWLAAQNRRDA